MMQWQTGEPLFVYNMNKQHLLFACEVSKYNLLCGLNECVWEH